MIYLLKTGEHFHKFLPSGAGDTYCFSIIHYHITPITTHKLLDVVDVDQKRIMDPVKVRTG